MTGKEKLNYSEYPDAATTHYAGAVGFVLTPVHIMVFGSDMVDLSILGGMLAGSTHQWSQNGNYDHSEFARTAPYLGIGVDFNLGKSFSFTGQVKLEEGGNDYGQAVTGVTYRF